MEEHELNELALKTPKPTHSRISATSTIDKNKPQIKPESLDSHLESSLGLLSLNSVDVSNILNISLGRGSIDHVLEQQRRLANDTLQRSSKVTSIPSKLLRPDMANTKSELNLFTQSDSTISESDLLQTPKSTSTPRSSAVELKDFMYPSLRNSISHFTQRLDSNAISIDNFAEEFQKIIQASNIQPDPPSNCDTFLPAEEVASKLMADEMSWKRKHDLPVKPEYDTFHETKDLPSISMGEFFQQRSDNLSDLQALSPKKSRPIPLIDSSQIFNNEFEAKDESGRSLSVTAIWKLLAKTEDTPKKVIDYLCNQKGKVSQFQDLGCEKQNFSSEVLSLPVSTNTSYTSSFSDNEAMKVVVNENKENIEPVVDKESSKNLSRNSSSPVDLKVISSSESRSSSSLSSLPNGKLPIESTKNELVWGCVKVDRCVTKEFLLRNKTPKTIRLQCSLSGYEFKIRKDNRSDSDLLSACKFVLHGHETRSLIISYLPTKIGSAFDELCFSPLDSNLNQTKKQSVRLWGYGGYVNIEYQNAIRDNTGKCWLSLGRMDNRVIMEQSLLIKNTGKLPSFSYIKLHPKHLITSSNLKIEPNLFVLLPNKEKNIKVSYIPNAKDCRLLKRSLNALTVADIGKLEVVSGPEVTRARLRRLCRKMSEKGLTLDPLCKTLKEKIIGEVFPSDVSKFKENPASLTDILETFNNDEIIITIEQDPNQTLVAEYPEDSAFFQSICQENTIIMNDTAVSYNSCRLEPPSLAFFPPSKTKDCLYLISETQKTLHFEVNSSPNGLDIVPTDGTLLPGKTTVLKISLNESDATHFKVSVYVENEVFESEVKVIAVTTSNSFLE